MQNFEKPTIVLTKNGIKGYCKKKDLKRMFEILKGGD